MYQSAWTLKIKRVSSAVLLACVIGVQLCAPAFGQTIWMDGGIIGDKLLSGAHEYRELCFITGEPVLLTGTVKVPEIPENRDTYTLKYRIELSNPEKKITLERDMTLDVKKTQKDAVHQTAYVTTLPKYSETIEANGATYTLGKYTFSDSRIEDNTPAVDYFSGNITAMRTYYKNGDYAKNEGYVTYVIDAKPIVGYDHAFGAQETRMIKQEIRSYAPGQASTAAPSGSSTIGTGTTGALTSDPDAPEGYVVWSGVVDIGMASTRSVSFVYQHTDPQSISFRGSYFKVSSEENVLTYSYDLPMMKSGAVDANAKGRNTGDKRLSKNVILESKPLITPRIRDIGGHWAEDTIFLLTSMEMFAVDKEYFVPKATISRLDFGKAMVIATHGVLPEPSRTEVIKRLRPGVETPYLDILPEDPDYHYIQYIKDHEIMNGKNYYFKPDEPITRAEAITVMIRALGLQYIAPAPPYKTVFTDDAAIGGWARDYIYVANEIGLISGTPEGYVLPNQLVTKEEAAAMLYNFMTHLKDHITYDYREKLLNR